MRMGWTRKMSGSHPDASLVSETTINGAIGPWREEGGWFSDKHETRERENEDTEYNRNRSLGLATLPASSQVLAVQCSAVQCSAAQSDAVRKGALVCLQSRVSTATRRRVEAVIGEGSQLRACPLPDPSVVINKPAGTVWW